MTKKKEKSGTAAGAAAGAAAAKSGNNADIRSFLQAAAGGQASGGGRQAGGGQDQAATPGKRKPTSPMEQAAKRTEYQEEEEDDDVFEEAQEENDVMECMRKELVDAGMSPQQAAIAMGIFMKGFQALVKKAAKEAAAAVAREVDKANVDAAEAAVNRRMEEDRCRRSILIHNADNWLGHLSDKHSLAEHITAWVHINVPTVTIMDAFMVGQAVDKPATSVFVTFGSATQKVTFFRMLAKTIQDKRNGWEKLNSISCRDAFPKRMMAEAKKLAQKGFSLRQSGKVANFRVVARGPACNPTLEVRTRMANNMRGRWENFKEMESSPTRPQAVAAAATPPRGDRSVDGRISTPRKTNTGIAHIENVCYVDVGGVEF